MPDSGLVSISMSSFNSDVANLRVKIPFGWITYMAKKNTIKIPGDLPNIEYEYDEDGMYLIATRDDFSIEKQVYQEQTQKLLNVMTEIKQRVPDYSKT
jgi:hypothetical protein